MVTLGDLVRYVLANRRGNAFLDHHEHDIASLIDGYASKGTMFYACDQENNICGIVIASRNTEAKVVFVLQILTTESWVLPEFIKMLKTTFKGYKLKAHRWKGTGREKEVLTDYNTNRLMKHILKGT